MAYTWFSNRPSPKPPYEFSHITAAGLRSRQFHYLNEMFLRCHFFGQFQRNHPPFSRGRSNQNTVEPACKVSVLSNENWPYKRADLISGHLFWWARAIYHGFFRSHRKNFIIFGQQTQIPIFLTPCLWLICELGIYWVGKRSKTVPKMPKYWLFPTVLTIQAGFWSYKRANLLTECPFGSGPVKNWPYKRAPLY